MSRKPIHYLVGASIVAALTVPVLAQSGEPSQGTEQGARALTFLRTGTSISVDDRYLYVLGNGQVLRIDKGTGAAAGQLSASGWSEAGAAPGGAGTTGTATTGSTGGK